MAHKFYLSMDLILPEYVANEVSSGSVTLPVGLSLASREGDLPNHLLLEYLTNDPSGIVTSLPVGLPLASREDDLPNHLPPEAVGPMASIVSPVKEEENMDPPPVVVGSVGALDRSQDSHTLSTLGGSGDSVLTDSFWDYIEQIFVELSSNFGGRHEVSVPSYITLPCTNDVIWHKGTGYIFDEEPSVATFNYDGGIYRGKVNANGLPNGLGYYIFNEDVYYFGNWLNGIEHGFGLLVWANGTFTIDLFDSGRKFFQSKVMPLPTTDQGSVIHRIHEWPTKWFNFAH